MPDYRHPPQPHSHHPQPPPRPLTIYEYLEHLETRLERVESLVGQLESLDIFDMLRAIDSRIAEIVAEIGTPTVHVTPTAITFTQESATMLPPVAGNTLVYQGTLSPAGAVYPTDTTFALVSSDPTVTPTVDATGLVVTIPLPATFVDSSAAPFNVAYTATSLSTPSMFISATITPSVPTSTGNVPTSITFAQTT
jgi:hypothetical protein